MGGGRGRGIAEGALDLETRYDEVEGVDGKIGDGRARAACEGVAECWKGWAE